jgi:hypothetical protein
VNVVISVGFMLSSHLVLVYRPAGDCNDIIIINGLVVYGGNVHRFHLVYMDVLGAIFFSPKQQDKLSSCEAFF